MKARRWPAVSAVVALSLGALATASCERGPTPEQVEEVHALRTLAVAELEENRASDAERDFRRIAEIAPDEPLGHAGVGVALLRQGRYAEAEAAFRRALDEAPEDPDIGYDLGVSLELGGDTRGAVRAFERTLEGHPDHVPSLTALARLRAGGDAGERPRAAGPLRRIVRLRPGNLPARLRLLEILAENEDCEALTRHAEAIRSQVPNLSPDASEIIRRVLDGARADRACAPVADVRLLHNLLRSSPLYRAGVQTLEGPTPAPGIVPTALSDRYAAAALRESVAARLALTDVTGWIGLGPEAQSAEETPILFTDWDGDSDPDLLVLHPMRGRASVRLYTNDGGRYVRTGSNDSLPELPRHARLRAGDFDNDGLQDVYVTGDGADRLFRNTGREDVLHLVPEWGEGDVGEGRDALFADLDHDGDLDLLTIAREGVRFYRNALPAPFVDRGAEAGLGARVTQGTAAAFADLDDDGDLDLVLGTERGGVLAKNGREGRFHVTPDAARLPGADAVSRLAIEDFDGDGAFDVVGTSGEAAAPVRVWRNRGAGDLELDPEASRTLDTELAGTVILDLKAGDMDNDGAQDLVVVSGIAGTSEAVLSVFRGGPAGFRRLGVPVALGRATRPEVVLGDVDGDGDLDIAIGGPGVRLFRNDGGDAGGHLDVRLVGLSSGSGKVNHYGIGSRVDLFAGSRRISRVVTGPITHFGLGGMRRPEVLRVQWTNGVPQNEFRPETGKLIVEKQVLKGSCAFLYAWDGGGYRFVTDMMWKSALGMPLGIMAGRTTYGPPDASREYLRVGGEALVPRDGVLSLRITEELWEVAYLDRLDLIVLDHPDTVSVWGDERFRPPFDTTFAWYAVGSRRSPVSARDGDGVDVLPRLRARDDLYVDNLVPGPYQGLVATHDLMLDLGSAGDVVLFLNGWLFPTDASINVALGQSGAVDIVRPSVQVRTAEGRWRTVVDDMSFPTGKNKTIALDLRGKFLSGDRHVRIRTNMQIYWDYVFFASPLDPASVRWTRLRPGAADLRYRGFSRTYRKGGPNGPHWFDYDSVSPDSPWREIPGTYTRYGDVADLLRAADDEYVILAPGDEIAVSFPAREVAPPRPGWTRTYLVYSDGFMKDADLNTAEGATVEPLPYHDMPRYPYGAEEGYPRGSHEEFLTRYTTRRVPGP
ncbi:MAG: FG-GAP-like repeat-containing protein [Gemmatimonadota bacterium]